MLINVFWDDHGDRKCRAFHKTWSLPALTVEKTSHIPCLKILCKAVINPASFICQTLLSGTYHPLSRSITEGCRLEILFLIFRWILSQEGHLRGNTNPRSVPPNRKACQISFFTLCWNLHWPNLISCNDSWWVREIGTAQYSHFCRLWGKD